METVVFRGSRQDLQRLLRSLPATLAGGGHDGFGIARDIQLRLGTALLSKIQQDFITKSRGGTGEDGITWKPLRPETIAQRRTTAGERKALGIGGRRVRGLLTPAQDRRWRALFASRKNQLMAKFGLGDRAASEQAAKIAWAILKREGALTKLAVLGHRQVDICRDTSRYFRSLSPGVQENVLEVPPGRVIVGTNVAYAGRQHAMRPLWPKGGNLPRAWWERLLETLQRGLLRALVLIVSRA